MTEIQSAKIIGTPALEGTYISEMDPWPFECQEFNRLYQFYDNLREGRFTTTKCRACGNIDFPPSLMCTKCWSEDLEWIDLPQKARVVAVTEVMAGAPLGFPSPLVLAWPIIDADGVAAIDSSDVRTAQTDSLSAYELRRLEPGFWRVQALLDRNDNERYDDGEPVSAAADSVRVTPLEETELNLIVRED